MTIRSIIRPYFEDMGQIITIVMAITVLIIFAAPVIIRFGIPAGISAWWNEKPVLEAVISKTLYMFCYTALPDPYSLTTS